MNHGATKNTACTTTLIYLLYSHRIDYRKMIVVCLKALHTLNHLLKVDVEVWFVDCQSIINHVINKTTIDDGLVKEL